MTSRASKLVLAAALAGAIPALASADDRRHDCDHDRGGRPVVVVTPVHAPPAYVPPAPAPRAWRDPRWQEHRWRERELASVRAELARLEADRAAFHARHAHRPGQLRKYDRRYLERRAQLEHREHELLMRVAWR